MSLNFHHFPQLFCLPVVSGFLESPEMREYGDPVMAVQMTTALLGLAQSARQRLIWLDSRSCSSLRKLAQADTGHTVAMSEY